MVAGQYGAVPATQPAPAPVAAAPLAAALAFKLIAFGARLAGSIYFALGARLAGGAWGARRAGSFAFGARGAAFAGWGYVGRHRGLAGIDGS